MSNIIDNLPHNKTQAAEIIKSFEIALATCSLPSFFYSSEKLPGIGITFHVLATILASVPTVLCCLISFYIISGHYFHWVNPKEQKQIVLCIAYLPFFTVVNFFALWFYRAYYYITPVLVLYNAKGLIAVFLLYIAYLCPEELGREHFHSGLERRGYYGKKKHDKGSLRWFRIIWVLVFQLVPFTLATFPINYIIQHVTCPLENSRTRASITLAVVQFLNTAIAWNAIFFYYRRTRSQLKTHRGSRKLNCFQSLVALQAIQSLVFPLVAQSSVYYPTKYVSYEDFSSVVPAFMTCWESLIFSILFVKVFSFSKYRDAVLEGRGERPASVGRAVLDTINQMDVIRGTVYLVEIMFRRAERADSRIFEKSQTSSSGYASVEGSEEGGGDGGGEVHGMNGLSASHHGSVLRKLNLGEA